MEYEVTTLTMDEMLFLMELMIPAMAKEREEFGDNGPIYRKCKTLCLKFGFYLDQREKP